MSLELTNSIAIDFWTRNFGVDERVPNLEFKNAIQEVMEEQKIKKIDEPQMPYNKNFEIQELFAKTVTEQIFWPVTKIAKNRLFPDYVDKSCVQFVINTFGPWSRIFQTIYEQFEDEEQQIKPLVYFHGRISEQDVKDKLKIVGDFLIRYNNEENRGLILSWSKPSKDTYDVTIKHEKIRRRKLKGKNGKPSRVVWTWEEKIAMIGGFKTVEHNFSSVKEFIEYKQGISTKVHQLLPTIKRPVMFVNPFRCYGQDSDGSPIIFG